MPRAHPRTLTHKPGRCLLPVPLLAATLFSGSCDARPDTTVVMANDYPPSSGAVVYEAKWLNVVFEGGIAPGSSSDAQGAVPTSGTTAYVVLAPNWDPAGDAAPASFVLLQSRAPFAVHLNESLRIAVDDKAFAGRCDAASPLSQAQADTLVNLVFPELGIVAYDAATCTATLGSGAGTSSDAGAP